MDNENVQNVPDNQGQGQAGAAPAPTVTQPATPAQPVGQAPAPQAPAPTPQAPPTAPEPEPVNPLLESQQTKKAIEFFRANPDVLKHVNEQVTETLPDFNPAPDQFVSKRRYLTDQAIARHGLGDDDAKLLAGVPEDSIAALAARLAAKSTDDSNVKSPPADPAKSTPQPPSPPDSGKSTQPPVGLGADIKQAAFDDFRKQYTGG